MNINCFFSASALLKNRNVTDIMFKFFASNNLKIIQFINS